MQIAIESVIQLLHETSHGVLSILGRNGFRILEQGNEFGVRYQGQHSDGSCRRFALPSLRLEENHLGPGGQGFRRGK